MLMPGQSNCVEKNLVARFILCSLSLLSTLSVRENSQNLFCLIPVNISLSFSLSLWPPHHKGGVDAKDKGQDDRIWQLFELKREMSVPKYSAWASLCSLQGICTTTTAFLHFFFLASFCWVLTEAWQSYMAVTGKIRTRLIRKRFLCLGWGKSVKLISSGPMEWNV